MFQRYLSLPLFYLCGFFICNTTRKAKGDISSSAVCYQDKTKTSSERTQSRKAKGSSCESVVRHVEQKKQNTGFEMYNFAYLWFKTSRYLKLNSILSLLIAYVIIVLSCSLKATLLLVFTKITFHFVHKYSGEPSRWCVLCHQVSK